MTRVDQKLFRTITWVGILLHFYEGAFQRCRDEKRRRRRLTDKWEQSRNTQHFLVKCFFNYRTGAAFAMYLAPILLMLAETASR